MKNRFSFDVMHRRTFLLGGTALAAGLPAMLMGAQSAMAATGQATQSVALERSEDFKAALAAVLKGDTPLEDGITVDLPEIAENGNFVPITIAVDSPMTDTDHITAIHLLSTANPVAAVATFRLSPINGVARVQSRMRLAKTQDVIVIAEKSDGTKLMATTLVKVTIGGCSS